MKVIVAYDVRVPGIIEVEADSEEDALDNVLAMDPVKLLQHANSESTDLLADTVYVESTSE